MYSQEQSSSGVSKHPSMTWSAAAGFFSMFIFSTCQLTV